MLRSLLLAFAALATLTSAKPPPQAALDACSSLQQGSACSFSCKTGTVSGTCQLRNAQLVCKKPPPQAAIDACSSLAQDAACSFTGDKGQVSGSCKLRDGQLACKGQRDDSDKPCSTKSKGNDDGGKGCKGKGGKKDDGKLLLLVAIASAAVLLLCCIGWICYRRCCKAVVEAAQPSGPPDVEQGVIVSANPIPSKLEKSEVALVQDPPVPPTYHQGQIPVYTAEAEGVPRQV